MHAATAQTSRKVPVREIVLYFLRLGFMGFGGPVALVGQMERELVGERKWLTPDEMREAVAVCQSLPGPLAIQVGIFIAYLRGGFWGAWAGGWAFILPNFLIVAALGALFVHFGDLKGVSGIFYGVSPAVIALILHSSYRLAKLGMEDRLQWLIAAACFAVTVLLEAEVDCRGQSAFSTTAGCSRAAGKDRCSRFLRLLRSFLQPPRRPRRHPARSS